MKNYKNILYIVTGFALLIPQVSFAAFDKIKTLLRDFKSLLDLVVPVIFGLALIFFFYGLAQFIRSVSDKTIQEGKNKMIWGVVSLFVMFSIWGIIRYIGESVNISTGITGGTVPGGQTTGLCNPDPYSGNPCP
jgi:hypothetical protein